jgi:hypothetical protein
LSKPRLFRQFFGLARASLPGVQQRLRHHAHPRRTHTPKILASRLLAFLFIRKAFSADDA